MEEIKEPEQTEQSEPAAKPPEPVHKKTQLSEKDYIASKDKAFKEFDADGKITNNLNWSMVWSEIITGIFLGLTQEQIDVYTDGFKYDVKQMEILKIAEYSGLNSDHFLRLSNPDLPPEEMLRLLFYSKESESFDGAKASIKSLMDGIDALKEKQSAEDKNRVEEYKKQIQQLEEQTDNLSKQLESFKEKNSILKSKLKSAEERMQNSEGTPDKSRNGLFKRKKNINDNEVLPADFDLEEYVIAAKLKADQLEMVNFAIQNNIPEIKIKQLIDKNTPAEQMRNVIKVIITKRAQEEKEE